MRLLEKQNPFIDKEQEDRAKDVPKEELEIVEWFLNKFVMTGGSAKKGDQIDLKLILKSLPTRIDEKNAERVNLYDFKMI